MSNEYLEELNPKLKIEEKFHKAGNMANIEMDSTGFTKDMITYNEISSIEDWNRFQSEHAYRCEKDGVNYTTYIEYLNRPGNSIIMQIYNRYVPDKKCKILELGCNRAATGEYFSKRGHEVTCSDLSKTLELVEYNNPDITFVSCDLNSSFPDGQYDIIFCSQVIEHLVNDFVLLENIKSHLNDGGMAFVDTVGNMEKKTHQSVAHARAYPLHSLETLMRVAGFSIKASYPITVEFNNAPPNALVIVIGEKSIDKNTH